MGEWSSEISELKPPDKKRKTLESQWFRGFFLRLTKNVFATFSEVWF